MFRLKKLSFVTLILIALLMGSDRTHAQIQASLLVTTDADCYWKLDGVAQGMLKADDAKLVKTTAGEHLLQATSINGQIKWQGTILADASAQKLIKVPLLDMFPTWIDPATGLMWPRDDNGGPINWQGASLYCKNLRLGGFDDWRLPKFGELNAILLFVTDTSFKAKSPIHMHASMFWTTDLFPNATSPWEGYMGTWDGGHFSRWGLDFVSAWGARPSAICVRGP